MRKFEEMKQIIGNMKSTNYAVPAGVDLDDLMADMLRFVGTTDSDLREGIYSTFVTWCEETKDFSPEQVRHILNTSMDNEHLFLGVGESGTDSVFMRAFSSLLVCVALYVHYEQPFLAEAEIQTVKAAVLQYVHQEKDYRGYVEGKGWAHAIAHAADALAHILCIEKATDVPGDYSIGREGTLELLEAAKMLAINSELVYNAEEDERLAVAVIDAFESNALSKDDMCNWLTELSEEIERKVMPTDYYRRINQKHFMRSVYFKLMANEDLRYLGEFLFKIMMKEEED